MRQQREGGREEEVEVEEEEGYDFNLAPWAVGLSSPLLPPLFLPWMERRPSNFRSPPSLPRGLATGLLAEVYN